MSEDRDLNIFLLCKHNYIKIISRLDGIIENFENIKELNTYDCVSDPELLSYFINCEDDINFFIKKRNEINEKLEFCRKNIKTVCKHQYVNDVIDVDPERSEYITYCVICEDTL
jgi:hypothetical protein